MATLTITTPYGRAGYSDVRAAVAGDVKLIPFTFTPSTSYAAGGDTIPAGSLPAGYKDLINPWSMNNPGGYGYLLDVANSKLKIVSGAAAGQADVTPATNMQTTGGLGTSPITLFFLVR